jgi:hypothetical protein
MQLKRITNHDLLGSQNGVARRALNHTSALSGTVDIVNIYIDLDIDNIDRFGR